MYEVASRRSSRVTYTLEAKLQQTVIARNTSQEIDIRHDPTNAAQSSRRAESYPASLIRRTFDHASQLPGVLHLSLGEPSVPTPDFIVSAAAASLARSETRYVSNAGLPELRDALAESYSRRTGMSLSAANVMITFGASEALLLTLAAVVDPGDKVVVPDPGYPNYLGLLHLLGARPSAAKTHASEDFRLTAANVMASCDAYTKAIILNSPANPTGAVMRDAEVASVIDFASERGITVVSDEVYGSITYPPNVHRSALDHASIGNTVAVDSFSKSYAMTGWRIGYAIASPRLIAVMTEFQESVAACVPPFVQHAALAALRSGDEFVLEMLDGYRRRRDVVLNEVSTMRRLRWTGADGSFYAFLDIQDTGLRSEEFCTRLLDQERVALVPGRAFGAGGEGFVRLSFAAPAETLDDALGRLRRFTNSIPGTPSAQPSNSRVWT